MLTRTRKPQDVNYQKKLHQQAQYFRKNPTTPEKKLWEYLKGQNNFRAKFRRQWPIDRYIVDFCSLQAKLIVELDGAVHQDHIIHDQERDKILKQYGFIVLRFTNSEVEQNLHSVLQRIQKALHLLKGEEGREVEV